jgi:3-deoxy-D-manno-octulosonic-acid transferase
MPVPLTFMYFIYSLLIGLALFILLPRFLIDAFRHGKYVAGFRERLGSLSSIESHGRPVVWIHCVSVGETQAARPLVKGIRQQFPDHAIAISTITLTGQTFAREIFKHDVDMVFYFPFDWRWIVRRTLKAINPSAVLIMETELWPNFLRECSARKIPVAIVNGRLSGQSFRRYRLIKPFMVRILSAISMAIVQTEADAGRFRALGMEADKTFVSGNMKFDAGTMPGNSFLAREFRERFALGNDSPLILAASTHAPEEVIILNAIRQVISRSEIKPRLMIAPRHPERFPEVADLLKASGLRWTTRSARPDASDAQAEVILLDSIGELQSIYSLASIVFVGGSIARTGGQNILEPAAVGAAVITGPHTYNFQFIVETFVRAGAIIQLQPMSDSASITDLADVISDLLAHPDTQRRLGERARTLVAENRGATERTLELLGSILSESSVAPDNVRSLRALGAPSE